VVVLVVKVGLGSWNAVVVVVVEENEIAAENRLTITRMMLLMVLGI